MYTQTHTHDELLRHIFNTVSISYTSLPKTLSNLEHLTTSTAPHREKHQNCSTGTKKSLLPRVIYRHSYKIFEGHVSIYLAWKCWVNYLMNTLKNAFFCWFFFRLLWLLTFSFTLFHQSTSHKHQRCFKTKVSLYHLCALYVSYRKTNTSYLNNCFIFPVFFFLSLKLI